MSAGTRDCTVVELRRPVLSQAWSGVEDGTGGGATGADRRPTSRAAPPPPSITVHDDSVQLMSVSSVGMGVPTTTRGAAGNPLGGRRGSLTAVSAFNSRATSAAGSSQADASGGGGVESLSASSADAAPTSPSQRPASTGGAWEVVDGAGHGAGGGAASSANTWVLDDSGAPGRANRSISDVGSVFEFVAREEVPIVLEAVRLRMSIAAEYVGAAEELVVAAVTEHNCQRQKEQAEASRNRQRDTGFIPSPANASGSSLGSGKGKATATPATSATTQPVIPLGPSHSNETNQRPPGGTHHQSTAAAASPRNIGGGGEGPSFGGVGPNAAAVGDDDVRSLGGDDNSDASSVFCGNGILSELQNEATRERRRRRPPPHVMYTGEYRYLLDIARAQYALCEWVLNRLRIQLYDAKLSFTAVIADDYFTSCHIKMAEIAVQQASVIDQIRADASADDAAAAQPAGGFNPHGDSDAHRSDLARDAHVAQAVVHVDALKRIASERFSLFDGRLIPILRIDAEVLGLQKRYRAAVMSLQRCVGFCVSAFGLRDSRTAEHHRRLLFWKAAVRRELQLRRTSNEQTSAPKLFQGPGSPRGGAMLLTQAASSPARDDDPDLFCDGSGDVPADDLQEIFEVYATMEERRLAAEDASAHKSFWSRVLNGGASSKRGGDNGTGGGASSSGGGAGLAASSAPGAAASAAQFDAQARASAAMEAEMLSRVLHGSEDEAPALVFSTRRRRGSTSTASSTVFHKR